MFEAEIGGPPFRAIKRRGLLGWAEQKRRALLTARKLLQERAIAIENNIRGLMRNFGLKVGKVKAGKFEARIRDLIEGMPELAWHRIAARRTRQATPAL